MQGDRGSGLVQRLRGIPTHVSRWIEDGPSRALAWVAVAVVSVAYLQRLVREGVRSLGADPALFQHVGWYVTQGASPYVHAFDVKPPLVYETTSLLAVVSGGNPELLHLLSVLLTGAMFVTVVVLTGKLVHRTTGSPHAGFAAGAFLVAFAPFALFATGGFRPKYFALAAGLASLWLVLDDRPLASGVAGAVSAGFWHFGIVFPLLSLAIAARERSVRAAGRIVAGGAVTAIVVLVPVLAWGALEAMVTETLLAPTMTGEGGDLLFRGAKGILHLGWTLPLALAGAWGLARTLADRPDVRHWLGLGALLAALQVVFLDYDGPPDLFLGLVVLAIAFGIHLADTSVASRRRLTGLLGATLVVSVAAQGGFGLVYASHWETGDERREDPALVHRGLQAAKTWIRGADASDTDGAASSPDVDSPYGRERMHDIYWEQIEPTSCHYRLAADEIRWLEATNRPVAAETCGDWPDGHWGISW